MSAVEGADTTAIRARLEAAYDWDNDAAARMRDALIAVLNELDRTEREWNQHTRAGALRGCIRAALAHTLGEGRHEERWPPAEFPTWDLVDALMPIVTSAVEAAKATARRDALRDAAQDIHDEDYDPEVDEIAPRWAWRWLNARAELVPADCRSGCESAAHVYGCPNFGVQRSGGQGAQSGGHEYGDPEPMLTFTAEQMAGWDRQRDPGQPGEQGPAEEAT